MRCLNSFENNIPQLSYLIFESMTSKWYLIFLEISKYLFLLIVFVKNSSKELNSVWHKIIISTD